MYGWKSSIWAALGNISGLFCLGMMTIVGLGTILVNSQLIFNGIKLFGATYLVYLGLRMIMYQPGQLPVREKQYFERHITAKKLFFRGMAVALSNPKALLFLTALLPQFVNVRRPIVPQSLLLLVVLMVFSFASLVFYGLLAQQTRRALERPRRLKGFARTSGTLYITFGVLLATSR
jgi:threonine/homoserine/homoserine lactone efflux protein